jgi:hypothetical protein
MGIQVTVWQIAAGDSGRFYDHLFMDHDVMFMGPGDPGPLDCEEASFEHFHALENTLSKHKYSQLQQFAFAAQEGEKVILRCGRKAKAVGVVTGKYKYEQSFDDVHGWDLQHVRRVKWIEASIDELSGLQADGDLFSSTKQIPTFTAVHDERILSQLKGLLNAECDRQTKELPIRPPKPLSLDELGIHLFSEGLSHEQVERVQLAISRIRRLGHWYATQQTDFRPREHEVVSHVLLPLFSALGWSEQLLAVEWNNIDLAVFATTPRVPENCLLVCEAKALGAGLQDAIQQAQDYVKRLSLPKGTAVAVTDGLRVYLRIRVATELQWSVAGYINLQKIRTNHLAPASTNAVKTLIALTPAGLQRLTAGHSRHLSL